MNQAKALGLCAGIIMLLTGFVRGEQREFLLDGQSLQLEDVSSEVAVLYRSMRLNRALNVWNVEVSVSNQAARVLPGPLVLLIEGMSGTSGLQGTDGTLEGNLGYYDLSAFTAEDVLAPGQLTVPRTLTMGRSGSEPPSLTTRVYAGGMPVAAALGLTRTLNEAGQPLPAVAMTIAGPEGAETQATDRDSGVASFGQGPGSHVVKFSREGYLPVWRQESLAADRTTVLPNPRLTQRAAGSVTVTPLGGLTVSSAPGNIQIDVPSGAVSQATTLTLTPLTGQNLPAFLPPGWSPLNAFWLEAGSPLQSSLSARLRPAGPISGNETATLVRWNESSLQWVVAQTLGGQGTNAVNAILPSSGAYALVVADSGELAPPPAQLGQALSGSSVVAIDVSGLGATGSVIPRASPASVVPALVTGTANVELRHASHRLPSGYLLRGEVTETYLLSDGSLRLTPQYEHFIVGYQRPGDQDPFTLHASFPMRPLLLFGSDQLDSATVRVDVLPETPFDGQVLDENGGQIAREGVRLLAGSGRLTGPSALRLRRLDATVFTNIVSAGQTVMAAFDLTVDGSTVAGPLSAQLSGAPAGGQFVLARVLSDTGFYGLQPVERLRSDAQGNLNSLEPADGERLPGLRGSGQFVLIQLEQPQGLITGLARTGAGETRAGLPVRLTGLPWLTLTDDQGRYQLIAPAGEVEVGVTDPATGDTGFASVTIPDAQTPVGQDLATAPSGPRVVKISPADNATRVPRVGSVVIEFNEAVNPATVLGAIELLRPDDSVVNAALLLNLRNTIATLSPATELEADTEYRVRLAGTIADPGGLPLEGQDEFTFRTVALSARDPAAQLIIYEPGTTNVPPAVLAQIPAYEPGDDPFAIVVRGTLGVADPEVPVILVNESTGETATVLSRPDGSFASVISGTEEDFVSATFINLNGTRVYVPVSRQEFDNGFVGLYPQGGILEAESDGGPVRVFIEPQALPNRTKFRINTMSTAQLLQLTGGVSPEFATIGGGGMKIEVEGSAPREPIQVAFPVNLAQLGYPDDESPMDVAAALALVRDHQGFTTFEMLDQMVFEPAAGESLAAPRILPQGIRAANISDERVGTLLTVIGFVPSLTVGLATPLLFDYVVMPIILGSKPVVVKGITQQLPMSSLPPPTGLIASFSESVNAPARDAFDSRFTVIPVQGAFVILRPSVNPVAGLPGRLRPGMVHATSGADGSYLMVAPAANTHYIVSATHPGFADRPGAEIKPFHDISFSGAVFNRLIFRTLNAENAPLRVNVAHAPQYPAPEQDCEVQVSAFRGGSTSPDIFVRVDSVVSLTGDGSGALSDVVLTNITMSSSGVTRTWRGTLRATRPVQTMLKIFVDGDPPSTYPITFSGVTPPVVDTPLPKPDTNDVHGPIVISTFPPEGGYVGTSGEITILFNKPIDRHVERALHGVVLDGPSTAAKPILRLASDQRELVVQYPGLEPDQDYTLTLTSQAVRDLSGQPLDQRPSTPEPDSFRLSFRTSPVRNSPLRELMNGRGAAISGQQLYVIEGTANYGSLLTYDITDPGLPNLLSRTKLFGQPRDLVVIPQYAYRRTPEAAAVTNDLVAVVGGDLDTVVDSLGNVNVKGQYLTVFDMADPSAPAQLASPIVSYRVGSAVTKVRWSPPNLIYQEFGSDIQQLGLVHLQELIIGFGLSVLPGEFRAGREGVDLNGDGDYVDEGEVVPIPEHPPLEFYGKRHGYVLAGTTQKILDFSPLAGGQLIGTTLTRGSARNQQGEIFGSYQASYRTLALNLDTSNPTDSALPLGETAYPRWVSLFSSLPILIDGVPLLPMVALVSLQPDNDGLQKVAVIDISLPQTPRLINTIPISEELLGGNMQTVRQREDGLLELAGGQNVVLLDSIQFGVTNVIDGQAHPAIVGFIPSAGAGSRTLGASEFGYHAMADGGRGALVQTPPAMRFVNFPASPVVVDPAQLSQWDDQAIAELTQTMRTAFSIPPARVKGNNTLDIPSDLNPPRPSAHFHVYLDAPGSSGKTIELGLESVNHAGRPLSNLGVGYAPVRAISEAAQEQIGQMPRPNCGALIRSLTAWRMSDDPHSPFYHRYLSRPFALVANESISPEEIATLQRVVDREILHSGAGLRAFIDPSLAGNASIGLFAARLDSGRKLLLPVASVNALTLFHPYIMGDNPPPAGGYAAMPATYGMVAAHSLELRTETVDMELPSPRMPISIQRAIGNQDTYEGSFGPGWDFNYNQRLTELDPLSFPIGLQMPLIVRANKADSEIAGSQDLLFSTGMGRVHHFRWVSTQMPPEYAQDPLVQQFDYQSTVSDYFLPAKGQGIFDLLVKFGDGRFERLTPDGTRYRYSPTGRLEAIIDRFPANRHQLEYDRNGWLTRIDDRSVRADRYVEFGYYRTADDPDFRENLDEVTANGYLDGKVRRLRNYAQGDVLFHYNDEGFLVMREGVEVEGENGGFSGRAQTHYAYNRCRFAGIKVTQNGAPLFAAETTDNSVGKPVARSGAGIGGSVRLNAPLENSAATLEGQLSSADLAGSSKMDFTFDKLGHLTSVKSSGPRAEAAESTSAHNENGQLTYILHPEGKAETFDYDSANPVFRSRGNLIGHQVDPGPRGGDGYTLEFSYDPRYNLSSGPQRNANGFVITHRLRPDGRELLSIQHGNAGTEEFTHNDNGQLLTSTDTRGVHTSTTYEANTGFPASETSGDSTYTYSYGGSYASRLGLPSIISLPEGAPVRILYNRKLQTVEKARGDLLELSGYDEQGRKVFRQIHLGDGKAPIMRWEFDNKGFLTRKVTEGVEIDGAVGSVEYLFTPDEMSRIQSVRFPQGTVQTHEYDGHGNLVERTVGDYVEEYEVDLNGNQTALRRGGELVRTTLFDGLDRPVRITDHTGTKNEVLELTYYPGGQPKSQTRYDDEFGLVEELNYDAVDELGRPVTLAATGTTINPEYRYVYEPNAVSEIGPRMTMRKTWNAGGHSLSRTTAILTENFTLDGNGNVRAVERREDGATYNGFSDFDTLDNPELYSDDLGLVFRYVARADGKLRSITNARGHETALNHSALGELLSRRRADGMEFRHRFDELRLTSFTGDIEAGFQSTYDGTIRLSTSTQRDGAVTTFSDFNPQRQPQSVTMPGGNVAARYDLKQRLIERTITYQSTSYSEARSYDALDRLREHQYRQDGGTENRATYTYDTAGPLLSARFQEDGADFLVGYTYYNDRSRQSITYPSGWVVSEERDAAARLLRVSDADGVIIGTTSWQGNTQPRTVELGRSVHIENQYDARGRLAAFRATRVGDGAVLAHMRYQYDAANNMEIRQFLHRGGRADVFTYDQGERVSTAKIGALPLESTEDAAAFYQRTYNYHSEGLDYLTSVSTIALGLSPPPFAASWSGHDPFLLPSMVDGFDRSPPDPRGNVRFAILPVRPMDGAGPSLRSVSLVHNGNGNLIRVTREDDLVKENFYQPDGLRYRARVTQGPLVLDHRHFVYDSAGRLLEEYDLTEEAPLLIARYFYAAADAPEAADLYDSPGGQLRRYYFLKDAVESVIAVVDSDGNVVERAWYDTFGQPELEQRDEQPPVLTGVSSDGEGSFLIAMSESLLAPFDDPGPGIGIVSPPVLAADTMITVSVNATNITGTTELLPSLEGFAPFSVLRFTPAVSIPLPPSSLAGWWPGDSLARDVAGGNDGVLRGGASVGPGVNQQAFVLNGVTAYVEIADAAALNVGGGDFTVSTWVNFGAVNGGQVLLEKWVESTRSGWSLVKSDDQRLRLTLGNGAGGETTVESAPLNLVPDSWLQVAARRQGDQFTLFTNGVAVATGGHTASLSSAATLKFGSREGAGMFLNGSLDEVTLYSRALSDQEIVSVAGGLSALGPVTVTVNAGTATDEWGNLNEGAEVSFDPVAQTGAVYYAARPEPRTAAARLARSVTGSPFLFHGQYFDYDTGLIYLRARFYDPFAGMFLQPDPLGYEDSVNLYAGMGNNPVGYRDPSGLSFIRSLIGRLAVLGARHGDEAAAALKPSILSRSADEISDAFWMQRAAAATDVNQMTPLAERIGKYSKTYHHLSDEARPLVLGLDVGKGFKPGEALDPRSFVNTANQLGGVHLMNPALGGRFYPEVMRAINAGRKIIVDVSHMSGRTLAHKIESSVARRFVEDAKTLQGRLHEAVNAKTPFATDMEMLTLYMHGQLPNVTFVQRFGDDIYELANPFVRQATRGAEAGQAGSQLLRPVTMEQLRTGTRRLQYGIGSARAGAELYREPDQFQIP